MDKISREHAAVFAALVGGLPITFLLRFPDGEVEELGGVVITSRKVKAAAYQLADALEECAKRMREQADEHEQEHKCAHHTDNPSRN